MPVLTAPSTGPITSRFGPRPPLPFHHGLDWGFWKAAPDYRVFAAAAGRVSRVWKTISMGNIIEVDLGGGYRTRYNHLANAGLVAAGQTVTAGQHIGTMGHTGLLAAGTHLHFELWVNGVRVDPAPYFTGTAGGDATPIKARSNEMSKLYHKADSTPTLYALAGDSPGTPANWLETTAQSLANAWSAQIGGPSAAVNAATWDTYKAAYLSPLAVAGGPDGGASTADVNAAADRVIAAVPTADQNGAAARAQIVKPA